MRAKTLALTVVCLAGCLVAHGQQTPSPKPDFSGTWKFDPERSSLQITPPDASTFVIEHDDPHWRLERTHVFGGKSDTLTLELTTDGGLVTSTIDGWQRRARMHWEDRTLVLDSMTSRGEQVTTVVVRYKLEDDGRTFIAEEHLERGRESHDNLWVFEKSTP